MTADIPPPSEADLKIDIVGEWLSARAHHDYSNDHYMENIRFYRVIEFLCRRSHAAEAERDRLRAGLAEAVEALDRATTNIKAGGAPCNRLLLVEQCEEYAAIVAKHKGTTP